MKITVYGCSETILYGTDDDCSRLNSDREMVVGSNSRMVMVAGPIKARLFVKRGSARAGWRMGPFPLEWASALGVRDSHLPLHKPMKVR